MAGQKRKAEEFADEATEILYDSLSKLSPDEQDRRLAAFEDAVDRTCSSRAKERRNSRAQGFLARTLERVGLR